MNLRKGAIWALAVLVAVVVAAISAKMILQRSEDPFWGATVHLAPGNAPIVNAPPIADEAQRVQDEYQKDLQSQVDGVASYAASPGVNPEELARREGELPTMALPLLKKQLDEHPDPALERDVQDDAVRLKNALATQKRLDWYRAHTIGIFDQSPHDPAWSSQARAAILTEEEVWAKDPMLNGDEENVVYYNMKAAYATHSADALLAIMGTAWEHNEKRYGDALSAALFATNTLRRGSPYYTPWLRLREDLELIDLIGRDPHPPLDQQKARDRRLAGLNKLLQTVLADRDLPRLEVFHLFDLIGDMSIGSTGDRREMAAPLFELLQASPVDRSTVLTVQARFNLDYAQDVAPANPENSTFEEQSTMRDRLMKAGAAAEQAWGLDQTNVEAAVDMTLQAIELSDGENMELWFRRAVAADPDYLPAYSAKLTYVEPQYFGSEQALLKFGRECAATGRWYARVPWVFAQCTDALSTYEGGKRTATAHPAYFAAHPELWPELYNVYQNQQKIVPVCKGDSVFMGFVAASMGRWKDAHALFDRAGDIGYWPYPDEKAFQNARDDAAQKAAALH